jgi:ABC-type multidrug transport system ATPase subunit/peptidoglycan/LPS O-acetylase OafA/YrhL
MTTRDRLHALDAVRAFALLLGVVFHAAFSFIPGMIPGAWAIVDASPSTTLSVVAFVSHVFRMSLFFFVAGLFARLLHQRDGSRGFWANRLKRILLPLVVGWLAVFPAIAVVWVWGLKKTFAGIAPPSPAALPPAPPAAFPLTHLWFLYYLLVLYLVVMSVRALVIAFDRRGAIRAAVDTAVHGLARSGAAAFVLALPLTAALYWREGWLMWFGIPTPDSSLLPQAASLVGYGTAFSFGWLAHRQLELMEAWSRQWPVHAGGAVVASGVCLALAGLTPAFAPAPHDGRTLIYAFSYAAAIWCWCFAVLGAAVRFLSRPLPAIRYVSDASYWIYIVHLPVVVALQVGLGHAPLHWTIKFPLLLAISLGVLLVSYRYLVRGTFVGTFLNGRRLPASWAAGSNGSGSTPPAVTGQEVGGNAGDTPAATALASLEGVEKRYGKTVALAGLDLDLRSGELLAVLGPNGAGKSTAIGVWLGLLQPDAGGARLLGRPPSDVEGRRHVGVMMQEVGLTPELRVRELIDLTASYYANPLSIEEVLRRTHLEALADRSYGRLSAGQKRQVQFALAICGRPPVLYLDEPTVGLDIEARQTMWRTIREMVGQGCSVLLTTHYLEEAEALADRVAVIVGGRLFAHGTVDEIRSVVARKQISCSTTLTAEEVSAWPHVVGVQSEANRLRLTVVDAELVLRRLLASDASVRDVEVRQAGLAEAFVQLTREAA